MKHLALAALMTLHCLTAFALSEDAAGTYVALTEDGQPVEKILRVSKTDSGWRFEDGQPDGSWLDVSCHGGCEHVESGPDDLIRFFGSSPPENVYPECIHNAEFAFCRMVRGERGPEEEGFVLVVRAPQGWYPIPMARVADAPGGPGKDEKRIEELEAASCGNRYMQAQS